MFMMLLGFRVGIDIFVVFLCSSQEQDSDDDASSTPNKVLIDEGHLHVGRFMNQDYVVTNP